VWKTVASTTTMQRANPSPRCLHCPLGSTTTGRSGPGRLARRAELDDLSRDAVRWRSTHAVNCDGTVDDLILTLIADSVLLASTGASSMRMANKCPTALRTGI
jgi:hypothetical protein